MIDDISPAKLVCLISLPVALWPSPSTPFLISHGVISLSDARVPQLLGASSSSQPLVLPSHHPPQRAAAVWSHLFVYSISLPAPSRCFWLLGLSPSHIVVRNQHPLLPLDPSQLMFRTGGVPFQALTLSELSRREQDRGGDEQAGPGPGHRHGGRPAAGGRDGIMEGPHIR